MKNEVFSVMVTLENQGWTVCTNQRIIDTIAEIWRDEYERGAVKTLYGIRREKPSSYIWESYIVEKRR